LFERRCSDDDCAVLSVRLSEYAFPVSERMPTNAVVFAGGRNVASFRRCTPSSSTSRRLIVSSLKKTPPYPASSFAATFVRASCRSDGEKHRVFRLRPTDFGVSGYRRRSAVGTSDTAFPPARRITRRHRRPHVCGSASDDVVLSYNFRARRRQYNIMSCTVFGRVENVKRALQ